MELVEEVAGPLAIVASLRDLHQLTALDGYQREMTDATARLLDAGSDVLAVTQAVAHVNGALTSRLLELGEEALGPPPRDYSWLALGSHGRGEQVLASDQDSAIAYDDPDGPLSDTAPRYFARLAAPVVAGLDRAGIPLCSGGYMATQWCRPLGDFQRLFRGWVDTPDPMSLLKAEVFLDVRRVHGHLDTAALDRILVIGGQHGAFVARMARAAVTFRPVGSVRTRLWRASSMVDVKRHGTAPIVLLARLYALAGGVTEHSTAMRLQGAAAAGTLSPTGAERLASGYEFLTRLRLRHQVEQVRAGRPVDNQVRVGDLTPPDRDRLREVLHAIRAVQDVTASRFATHTLG
jgi:CBS domain-containing protein